MAVGVTKNPTNSSADELLGRVQGAPEDDGKCCIIYNRDDSVLKIIGKTILVIVLSPLIIVFVALKLLYEGTKAFCKSELFHGYMRHLCRGFYYTFEALIFGIIVPGCSNSAYGMKHSCESLGLFFMCNFLGIYWSVRAVVVKGYHGGRFLYVHFFRRFFFANFYGIYWGVRTLWVYWFKRYFIGFVYSAVAVFMILKGVVRVLLLSLVIPLLALTTLIYLVRRNS